MSTTYSTGFGCIDFDFQLSSNLSAFIRKGIKLSKKQRNIYTQRGAFHKTVIEFFDHVDVEIKRQNEVNLVFSKSLRK